MVAAACIVKTGIVIDGILDSKVVSEEDREAVFEVLVNHPDVIFSVVRIEHTEIDEINILQATMKAMRVATENVLARLKTKERCNTVALIDGNRVPEDMPVPSKWVIKGDGSVFSIAAASILAKVTRDRIMVAYEAQYPGYGLGQHKGYPTYAHRMALAEHGPCPIHRLSYAPVAAAVASINNRKTAAITDADLQNTPRRARGNKRTAVTIGSDAAAPVCKARKRAAKR